MLVKDEADIVAYTVQHLLAQVDYLLVVDNLSTDGTPDILSQFDVEVVRDEEEGFYQERKMTAWAREMLVRGFDWLVPCDADEIWYPRRGGTIRDYLASVGDGPQVVTGVLYDHVVTPLDADGHNPVARMGWRRTAPGMRKVAVRLRPDLIVGQGNHVAYHNRVLTTAAVEVPGLEVRHFSSRSVEQFIRKVRNGAAAYAATTLPDGVGRHWRRWSDESDEVVAAYFWNALTVRDPLTDRSVVFDPARAFGYETPLSVRINVAWCNARRFVGDRKRRLAQRTVRTETRRIEPLE